MPIQGLHGASTSPVPHRAGHGATPAKGFTLIEVMVTVAIVGILAAIAIPAYSQYIVRSARAEARAALDRSRQEVERFYTQNNAYPAVGSTTNITANSGDSAASNYYTVSIEACQPAAAACVRLVAAPGGAKNFTDATCGSFWVQTNGQRGFSGATGTAGTCW